jgi:hypothetical protein
MSNPISFRPDPEVQKKLDEYCKRESRSVSNVINYALKIFFKLLPSPAQKK